MSKTRRKGTDELERRRRPPVQAVPEDDQVDQADDQVDQDPAVPVDDQGAEHDDAPGTEKPTNYVLADDDLFADVDGLPAENRPYFVYRERPDGKCEFVSQVYAPFSPNDIKTKYGGGKYQIHVRDARRIVHKKVVNIAGEPVSASNPAPVSVSVPAGQGPPTDRIRDAVELLKLMKELNGGQPKEDQADAMSRMADATAKMTTTMMDITLRNMNLISDMQKEKSGASGMDVLNTTIENAGAIIERFLAVRSMPVRKKIPGPGPAKIPETNSNPGLSGPSGPGPGPENIPIQEDENLDDGTVEETADDENLSSKVPGVNIIVLLNKGQADHDDVTTAVNFVTTYYPNFVPMLRTTTFEDTVAQLKPFGLQVTDETWLKEVFNVIRKLPDGEL